MNDLLFAVPWWIPTFIALIGVLFINGNKTQVANLRTAGLAAVAVAIVWALVSFLVDTDKEKVEKGMQQTVQAAVDGDWVKFKSNLTPGATLNIGGPAVGADKLTDAIRAGTEAIKLRSAQVRDATYEQTGGIISVHCIIFTTQEYSVPMETTTWQFDWEKTGAGWKIREAKLIAVKDVPMDQVDFGALRKFVK